MSEFFKFDLGQINVAVGLVSFIILILLFSVFWTLNQLANKYVTSKIESKLKTFFMWIKGIKEDTEKGTNGMIDKQIYDTLKELRIKFGADRVALVRFKNSEYYINKTSVHKLVNSHSVFSKKHVEIQSGYNEIIASTIFEDYLEHIYTGLNELPEFVTRYDDCTADTCDFIANEKNVTNGFSRNVLMFDIDKMDNCSAKFILKEIDINFRIQTNVLTDDNKILGILCVDYSNLSNEDKEIIKHVKFKSDTIPNKITENMSICDLCRAAFTLSDLLKEYQ